jgi:hypothetical protein
LYPKFMMLLPRLVLSEYSTQIVDMRVKEATTNERSLTSASQRRGRFITGRSSRVCIWCGPRPMAARPQYVGGRDSGWGNWRTAHGLGPGRRTCRGACRSRPAAHACRAPSRAAFRSPSAATAARTGFRRVGDRGNCEEQDRRAGNASQQASLGGGGRFQCRCARQRLEGLIVLVQIGSALR